MKLIYEYFTNSLALLDNPIDNWMVMSIIGVLAYLIAFKVVGKLYIFDVISGRLAGHILHWIIRLFTFVIIFCMTAVAIRIYYWFNGLPDYKWWIISAVIAFLFIGKCVLNYILYKKKGL